MAERWNEISYKVPPNSNSCLSHLPELSAALLFSSQAVSFSLCGRNIAVLSANLWLRLTPWGDSVHYPGMPAASRSPLFSGCVMGGWSQSPRQQGVFR